jgi:hypothetical protein
MPKKLESDDDDLMKIFEHYAELRREHSEYEDTVRALECDIASLQGRVDQLEELNKQLTEERDQFLERYYRLVTQFELMGGSFDRARAGIADAIGYLRGRPEKQDHHEIPALPVAKSLGKGNGLEDGIAKIAAAREGERRQEVHENS